ncbi:MAG: PEP-CTERM sorting domain-containing protein [Armatimonadota bacterium]
MRFLSSLFAGLVLSGFAAAQLVPTILTPTGYGATGATGVTGATQFGFAFPSGSGFSHPITWNGSSTSYVDLQPTGFSGGAVIAADSSSQVGFASNSTNNGDSRAFLWTGTASSGIDLGPTGATFSRANAVAGGVQVGAATFGTAERAYSWTGTQASATDIHPTGYSRSRAMGTNGTQHFGWGTLTGVGNRAILWTGVGNTVLDLNPSGFQSSFAQGMDGSRQVGYGFIPGQNAHALMWNSTAASAVDLNPIGYSASQGFGINGTTVAGQAFLSSDVNLEFGRATVWLGSASNFIDLHSTLAGLPVTFVSSVARGVSSNGDIVGTAFDANNVGYAIRWSQPVPEPGTLAIVGLGLGWLGRRRRMLARGHQD